MFLYKNSIVAAMATVLVPTAMAAGAVQLKFNMDDVPGDASYFVGTNPTNYNGINWDRDLEDNGVALGLVPNTLAGVDGQGVLDAIDFNSGLATGISLTVVSPTGFNEIGPNRNGPDPLGPPLPAPAGNFFELEAVDTNLFGHDSNFNVGGPRAFVEYTIAGLSPSALYDLTFFGSRFGATENRETQYDVIGANSGVGFLDVTDNASDIAQVLQIQPTGAGELTLTIQKGPNNVNSDGFYYLGAFEILENGVAAGQDGDFDGDLDVDGGDFIEWQREFGSTLFAADLALWEANFGTLAPLSAIASVPEPSSALLLLLSVLGCGRVARSHNRKGSF